jgi:hypothetical protein
MQLRDGLEHGPSGATGHLQLKQLTNQLTNQLTKQPKTTESNQIT